MSYHHNSEPPACIIIGGVLALIVGVFVVLGAVLKSERDQAIARNIPPSAATVATVVSGPNGPSVEVASHYYFETVPTSGNLSDAQDPLVAWFAAHPDRQLVQVITLTRSEHGGGGTHGFIIVTEARDQ
jgi:hypothetical protein